jgi:hypothetical protein
VLLTSMWVEEVLVEGSRPLSPHPRPVPNELEDAGPVAGVVEVHCRRSVPSVPTVDDRGLDCEESRFAELSAPRSSAKGSDEHEGSLRGSQKTDE